MVLTTGQDCTTAAPEGEVDGHNHHLSVEHMEVTQARSILPSMMTDDRAHGQDIFSNQLFLLLVLHHGTKTTNQFLITNTVMKNDYVTLCNWSIIDPLLIDWFHSSPFGAEDHAINYISPIEEGECQRCA